MTAVYTFQRPLPVVADANVLMDELLQRSRREQPTHLGDALANGDARLFVVPPVIDEAARHLPDRARRRGDDLGDVNHLWDAEYRPYTRLVEIETHPDPRVGAVAARDSADEPTAALAVLVAPCILLTHDQHFSALGVIGSQWLETVTAARQLHLLDDASTAALFVTRLGWHALGAATQVITRSRFAPLAGLAAGAVLGWALDATEFRARIRRAAVSAGELALAFAGAQSAARTLVASQAVSMGEERTLVDDCAGILARADRPTTADELIRRLDGSITDRRRLLELLDNHPAFITTDDAWILGVGQTGELRRHAPWRLTPDQLGAAKTEWPAGPRPARHPRRERETGGNGDDERSPGGRA